MFSLSGQLVDLFNREIYPAEITVEKGRIKSVRKVEQAEQKYILPGFIDAHIHIESSMLVPVEFARIAVTFGTVATVSDPHEIANVCGIEGVEYMIRNGKQSPLKFYFGAPSCVPATGFETAGALISVAEIRTLLQREEIRYLTEMMNFPGVLHKDPDVMAKIAIAKELNKPVDGHAPGLKGVLAAEYAAAGITTDHECVSLEEALDKIAAGMHIIIREGSAARNFEALKSLLASHPGRVMFCSDDKHPDELLQGHINQLVIRALKEGYNLFDVLYAASVLPVMHYGLDVGLLRTGDAADFIVTDNLDQFSSLQTYIDGVLVADRGKSLVAPMPVMPINNFSVRPKKEEDFVFAVKDGQQAVLCNVIEALDGQLITNRISASLKVKDGALMADPEADILKIGVLNRYHEAPVSLGFVRNFGLRKGAIASSVAHDSHNIVFAGADDPSICAAVNAIIANRGGISVCDGVATEIMPLPIAGLMSDADAQTAASRYELLDAKAKSLGSKLNAPFMTLSFMALPVIPSLKMTDKGLFDVDKFTFANVLSDI
jgi:adenine deaminase